MIRSKLYPWLIVSMHLAGIIGLLSPWSEAFRMLTPLHILAVTAMLLDRGAGDSRYYLGALAVAVLSFLVEMAGVQSGLIFGDYNYGRTLGPKVLGTPLLIGVNWVLLTYTVAHLLAGTRVHVIVRAMLGATLMVGLDVLIEPVAIDHDFWSWAQGTPPLHNYLGWWFTAFAIFLGLFQWVKFEVNRLAPWVWVAQCGFFLAINILS